MLRSTPQLKGALLALFCVALVMIGIWVWIGIRVGIWTFPEYDRHVWLMENIPVDHLLWRGEIRAGDSAENLAKNWHPDQIDRFGPWVEMRWFPGGPSDDYLSFIGVCVVAKNDVLVSASSYSDDGLNDKMFFNITTTNDAAQFHEANAAYDKSLQAENAQLRKDLPILQEVWEDKIKKGDDVERLIKLWPPHMITRFGPWTVMRWFSDNPTPASNRFIGLRMIAKNGALVYANTFTDDGHRSIFINTETLRDEVNFDTAYRAYSENVFAKETQSTNSISATSGSRN